MLNNQQRNCQRSVIEGHLTLLLAVVCFSASVILSSCTTGVQTLRESPDPSSLPSVRTSIVCIIHGDGEYSYHDSTGGVIRADEHALADVESLAVRNPSAGVLIVHQHPRSRFLFWANDDETLTYWAAGKVQWKQSYRRDRDAARFDRAIAAYRRLHANGDAPRVRMLMYFGHEIPEVGGKGYDQSYEQGVFTIDTLATAARGMLGDTETFDLAVIGTCYNGSPRVIAALAPHAHTIVASPENLHRSYFELGSFVRLDTLTPANVPTFARVFARHAFKQLTESIQTAVTVAVYDVERVRPYLRAAAKAGESSPASLAPTSALTEHCDCADLPAFTTPGMSGGVTVFYRAARFGRAQHVEKHSGWECVK